MVADITTERLALTQHSRIRLVAGGVILIVEDPLTWEQFLLTIASMCEMQGWILDYQDMNDRSCAIFADTSLR